MGAGEEAGRPGSYAAPGGSRLEAVLPPGDILAMVGVLGVTTVEEGVATGI